LFPFDCEEDPARFTDELVPVPGFFFFFDEDNPACGGVKDDCGAVGGPTDDAIFLITLSVSRASLKLRN